MDAMLVASGHAAQPVPLLNAPVFLVLFLCIPVGS